MLACDFVGAVPVPAASEQPNSAASAAATTARHARHRTPALALDDSVRLLARELDLDAGQQAALKTILIEQGAEVYKVWGDASVPAAVRIGATQSIGEKTSDRIRAILDDEQRKKYMKAHRHEAPGAAPEVDVQKWMDAARAAEASPTATAALPAAQGEPK